MVITNIRKKAHIVKMADVYFYNPATDKQLPNADIITFYQSTVYEPTAKIFHTLLFDLHRTMDDLFNDINRRTKADLKKEAKLNLEVRHNQSPSQIDVADFLSFSDKFSAKKGITEADQLLMYGLCAEGALNISTIYDENKTRLCQHVYIVDGIRARALYSVSIRLELDDERRHAIAVANRILHWKDIAFYQSLGYAFYDFGGIAPDSEDPSLKGITDFKTGFGGQVVVEYHYMKTMTPLGKLAFKMTSRSNESL